MTDQGNIKFRSVLCTSPASGCPVGLDEAVSVQTGLVVADSGSQTVFFLDKELLVTFKDSKTAAQFLRVNDGLVKCLVEHYLALQRDLFGLGKMNRTMECRGNVRTRSAQEINNINGDVTNCSEMLSASTVSATRFLLEVTHGMLIELASEVLLELIDEKLETSNDCSISLSSSDISILDTGGLYYHTGKDEQQDSTMDLLSLSPVSPCSLSLSSSSSGSTSSDREECEEDRTQLDKLLQDRQSLLLQIVDLEIVELQRKIKPSPPRAYQNNNYELLQLETVSSEEGEWSPVPKKRKRRNRKKKENKVTNKKSLQENQRESEALDKVSSEDVFEDTFDDTKLNIVERQKFQMKEFKARN
eukprot:GFUD01114130.1.p1 GENE.GFUD01114130.1~~GFUD01114130.1.p1  ORF type:complete len:359 (+),score=105.55 GFUD01114130.1:64-1140(+)